MANHHPSFIGSQQMQNDMASDIRCGPGHGGVIKRILNTQPFPNTSPKGMRQGLIARLIVYGIIFVVGLYFEVPAIWWFMVGAIVCGVFIAFAIRRFRDREEQ